MKRFNSLLQKLDTSKVLSSTKTNESYDLFLRKFSDVFEKCFPKNKKRVLKTNQKPWYNNELKKLNRKKQKKYKTFIANRNKTN